MADQALTHAVLWDKNSQAYGLVVKRAGKDESGNWLLLSDHPSWKPLPWPGNAEIIGEVKWMARTL